MNIVEVFKLLGLSSEYAKIYDILLKNGKMRVIDLAEKTKLPRTSCYEYLPKLVEMNLVDEIVEGKSRYFAPNSPSHILNNLFRLKNDVNFTLSMFEREYSEMLDLYEGVESRNFSVISSIESLIEELEKLKDGNILGIYGPTSFAEISNPKLKKLLVSFQKKPTYLPIKGIMSVKLVSDGKILFINLKTGLSVILADDEFAQIEKSILNPDED